MHQKKNGAINTKKIEKPPITLIFRIQIGRYPNQWMLKTIRI